MTHVCPVCDYDQLDGPPYDETGFGSFEICPRCGTEFGVAAVNAQIEVGLDTVCAGAPRRFLDEFHAQARSEWIVGGRRWWSTSRTEVFNG